MRRLALSIAFISACAAPAHTTSAEDATLVVGRPADALLLDPAMVNDAESAEVCEQMYDHLTRFVRGSGDIEPALAESWDVTERGTQWTFHLRPGVRFSDGTPMNADAVVFSLERQRDPNHPFHRRGFGYWESTYRNILSVNKVDDLTVRIVIERPYAPFLANLAMYPASIVSPTAVRKWGDDFVRHPVGTGPFRLVEWAPGERVTLEANPNYWESRSPVNVKHLVFVTMRDARQRLVALEGGAVDIAESLAPADLQFVTLHPELRLERVAGNNVGYLAMNTARPPFDDVRVRRAINHAVDRTPIVKLIYQGLALPASGPLAPSAWGHGEAPPYDFDPARARALLAEAGYHTTKRPRLYVMSTPRPYMPAPEDVARVLASNLHDVGIDVDIVVNPIAEHLRATAAGEHDLCLRGWSGDNGDPDNFLFVLFDSDNAQRGSATNVSFYKDAALHGILQWAQESQDRGERVRFYQQADRIIHDAAPWVPLAHAEIVVARRARVGGLVVSPSALLYFKDVRLERR